jgi:membrane-associated phospholipid phosphatase
MRAAQASRRPALEPIARFVSDRSRLVLFATGAVALVAGGAARATTIEAAIVLLPVNLAVEGLKRVTNRPRPDGEHKRSNAAFPSSHTANAFAVASVIARRWRRAAVPAFLLAAAVGWSRIYLNRHWASDAVAGAALGISLALLVLRWWGSRRNPKDVPATV